MLSRHDVVLRVSIKIKRGVLCVVVRLKRSDGMKIKQVVVAVVVVTALDVQS